MYIKAVSTRMEGQVRKGDIVRWGIALSNSEVGAGKLRIDPLVYRLTNVSTVRWRGNTLAPTLAAMWEAKSSAIWT